MTNYKALLIMIGLLIALFLPVHSQEAYQLSGYVRESGSQEALANARVVEQNTGRSIATNQYGYFSLQLPADSIRLWISTTGMERQRFAFVLQQDTLLQIAMQPFTLETVEITEESPGLNQTEMSTISISVAEIERLPAFLGEVDVIKTVQLLPGVQSGNEGSNGLYVRGGGPDQNLILLDGV
ncbi:MAG: carboxypeptidase-like regulatory domain-containing protein, partial [Bacteroidota bacterium]